MTRPYEAGSPTRKGVELHTLHPECWKAAGCIGYALHEFMRARKSPLAISLSRVSFLSDDYVTLSEPVIQLERDGKDGFTTTLFFDFDSSHSERSEPRAAAIDAFEAAAVYIVEGSPVRKTDRAGLNTAGTRLCEGIGAVGVSFSLYKPCDD